jgi:DNA-binding transcriptional regulator LsrR (DeoR family)
VEIIIRVPFRHLLDLEARPKGMFGSPDIAVIPRVTKEPTTFIRALGHAAARYLLDHLCDGDVLAISGGTSVYSVFQAIEAPRP